MSFRLSEAIFYNVAPFGELKISFAEKGINVLTGLNGKGKTTIISYIVDALIEISKKGFQNEYEGKEHAYYRLVSSTYIPNKNEPSVVYLRFNNDKENIDYINIVGKLDDVKYKTIIEIDNPIRYFDFSNYLNDNGNVKYTSTINEKIINGIFSNNVLTYFPSYRFEIPSYLNKLYANSIGFSIKQNFNGFLPNPIEVTHSIENISNWILDVVLDWMVYKQEQNIKLPTGLIQKIDTTAERVLFDNLNQIISEVFRDKALGKNSHYVLRPRTESIQRLSIQTDEEIIAPNMYSLSAGEASIIGIFSEVIHQADKIHKNILLSQIQGIVLIDEIDKHLHMKLQKDVLPRLMRLFPNLQFIISSHSPFLTMGLAEQLKTRSKIYDLDNNGVSCEPEKTIEFENFYSSILQNNENYHVMYNELKTQTENITKPLIFTEGKTDWKHFKTALQLLQNNNEFLDIDVIFLEYTFENGDSKLNTYLENSCKTPHPNKIIGVFDCDEANGKKYCSLENGIKDFGNNVFSLSIPIPDFRHGMDGISVEFLYSDEDLKQLDSNSRRIYTTDEFNENGRFIADVSIGLKNADKLKEAHRTHTPKVIDSDVISNNGESKALSKNSFADNILNGTFKINELSGFRNVFEKLRIILNSR